MFRRDLLTQASTQYTKYRDTLQICLYAADVLQTLHLLLGNMDVLQLTWLVQHFATAKVVQFVNMSKPMQRRKLMIVIMMMLMSIDYETFYNF